MEKFKNKDTERFFKGERIPKFEKIKEVVRKKLYMLCASSQWYEVKRIGKNLHQLKYGRKGQWSLDVNDQYRICFIWENNQVWEIELVDYHDEKK